MNSLPPTWNPAKFNTSAFQGQIYLTKQQADGYYLQIAAGKNLGLIDGITPGTISNSKAVIVNSVGSISGFNSISASSLTLSTSATLTGTSFISLSNTTASTSSTTGAIRCSGGGYFGNDCLFNTQIKLGSSVLNQTNAGYLVGISAGLASSSKCLVVDINRDISNIRNLTSTNLTGTILTAAQPNITSLSNITTNSINSNITDALTSVISNPLVLSHSLSSGSPTVNQFGIGLLFNGPNALNNSVSYSRIYSRVQLTTNGSHQGQLILSSVFNGSLVDVVQISSLTSSTNNSVVINGSSSALSVSILVSSSASFSSILDSTSITTGALTCAGGLGLSKSCYIGLNLNVTGNTSSSYYYSPIALNMNYIGNWPSSLFWGLGPDPISNTVRLSVCSITGVHSSYANLNLNNLYASQIDINTPTTTVGKLNIQTFGIGLNLAYDSTHNGYFSLTSDSRLSFTSISGANNLQYWFDSRDYSTVPRFSLSGSSSPASTGSNHRLYLGNTVGDCLLTLFNQNSTSGSYGLGVNNNSMLYLCNGGAGHKFYYNGLSGTSIGIGSLTQTLDVYGNIICESGARFKGSSANGFSGSAAEVEYVGGYAHFFGFDRSSMVHRDVSIGNNNIFVKASSNGFVGINNNNPSCPLDIAGNGTATTSSSFGWLAGSGTGTATGFTNRSFSIKCFSGILVNSGEIDVLSDTYFKEDIQPLQDKMVKDFINDINPIEFNYINSIQKHYGYSAQELMLNNYSILVGSTKTDEPLVSRTYQNKDKDGRERLITIPMNTRLVVNPIDIIPILHQAIKLLMKEVAELKKNKLIYIG
jgi:Chaperone of endosialidase